MDRNSALAEASAILQKSNFSKEDSSRVTSLLEFSDRLSDKTELRKAAMRRRSVELGLAPIETPESRPEENQEFRSYLLASEQSTAWDLAQKSQKRALSTTTTAGGYLVPQSFSTRLESMLAKTDGLFAIATPFITSTGSATGYPVLSDESHVAAVVTENQISTTNQDLAFGVVAFGKCPMWRSNQISASVELANDSAFDLGQLIADAAGESFARGAGAAFTATLLAGAASGVVAAGTTAITSDEIFSLIDSVDESYGQNGSFLMRQSVHTALRKLKTTSGGQYVFPSERRADGVPLLAGYPVFISPSMGGLTAGEKAISFGDHTRFVRREVANSLVLKAYVERQAELGRVVWEAFWRLDGALLKSASVTPVKYLEMHA